MYVFVIATVAQLVRQAALVYQPQGWWFAESWSWSG